MSPQMENPATLGTCWVPSDLAGRSITSDNSKSLRLFQVSHLTRLYPVSAAMAEAIAPHAFMRGLE
jgi:hypothetical protein